MMFSLLRSSVVVSLAFFALACSDGQSQDTPFGREEVDPILIGPDSQLGTGEMGGSGRTEQQYEGADVTRNGVNYRFMANGWGDNFESQTVSWNGTAFTVESMSGTVGPNWQPASYPTVFCGQYSNAVSGECGLPAEIAALRSLRTGWWWDPHENSGEYNAAYDIWLANNGSFSGYFMVWYRNPPGQSPAGSSVGATQVEGIPGYWTIYSGFVNNSPIINYVRSQGEDTHAMEFDVLTFFEDARSRGLEIPGTHILSVAVGFEIWNGPVTNLESKDFYVEVELQ
jgi:hypothetical protein